VRECGLALPDSFEFYRTAWFISGKGVPMKCAFCASVCAIFIATASMVPVFAGEVDFSSRQIRTVQQFNELLNAGEFDQAETLAKDCFVKNSSDPLAVLMLRQIILTRKETSSQIVFPATVMKSRVITPNGTGQGETHSFQIQFGVSQPLITSAMKSCSGSCLEPLNAALSAQIAGAAAATQATSKVVEPLVINVPAGQIAQSVIVSKPDQGQASSGLELSFLPQRSSGAQGLQVDRIAANGDSESAISLHLIKGPVALLERLGIAIQSEIAAPHLQPRLDAAKKAVPTPITVPALPPTTEATEDSPLVPLIPHEEQTFEVDLSGSVCSKREKIIRHIGESLATRHISVEERNEILKAAQGALGVSITQPPKVKLVNDQSVELSGSVIDSAGKALGLSIHNFLTPDQRAVLLQMTFHSEQGPAALSHRVSMSDFLESEEGLLIALDAPLGATGLGVVNAERVTTYLVVSPKLRNPIPPKVAQGQLPSSMRGLVHGVTFEVLPVAAERKVGDQLATQLETRICSVADLVKPILNCAVPDGAAVKQAAHRAKPDHEALIHQITHSVAKNEWQTAGGRSNITFVPETISLLIKATPQTHQEVQGLLTTLRKELDVQFVGEIRIISGKAVSLANAGFTVSPQDVQLTRAELDSRQCSTAKAACLQSQTSEPATSCEMCENLRPLGTLVLSAVDTAAKVYPLLKVVRNQKALTSEFGGETDCCKSEASLSAKLLTAAQLKFLMNGVQGYADCNVMQAPKVTMFNGQTATIECGQDMSLSLKVVVSADQRTMATTLSIPGAKWYSDCKSTQSFHGQLRLEESLLIPIPGQSTTGWGKANDQVHYLLVTPRIINVREETEVQPAGVKVPGVTGKTSAKGAEEFSEKWNDVERVLGQD
jgi:hypothetical protein